MPLRTLPRRAFLKLMSTGLMAAGLSGLWSSSARSSGPLAGANNSPHPHPEWVPETDRMFDRIKEIYSWGIRRPAYPAGRRAEEYILQEFAALGLENVRKEPVPLMKWEPTEHSLHVVTEGNSFEIDCFPLPHTALNVDLELELALFDGERPEAVQGRAALHRNRLMEGSATLLVEGGDELETFRAATPVPIRPEGIVVDPGGTLSETRQILPFPPNFHAVMAPSQAAGALAFIGVLEGHPGDICEYYMPYDAKDRPFPAVWIRESDGKKLLALLDEGSVTIKLVVKATREEEICYNIVGELPGPDEEVLLIGSHHDGPWASAVEDASGMSLVLAQAEYWSRVPQDDRPHSMHFILQAGHMANGAGLHAFIDAHRSWLDKVVLEVHLEHTANEVRAGADGPELTGRPEPRWFFTSRNAGLQNSVKQALLAENLDRSLILAPDVIGNGPTTDGGSYHLAGVPIVNFLTAPFYLFDPLDAPDKIHKPSLEGITRATIRILQDTRGISADEMRAGIVERQS
jgi:hypothetical protein